MTAIDYTFNKLFSEFLSSCDIQLIFVRMGKVLEQNSPEFWDMMKSGFSLGDTLCSIEGGVDEAGDLDVKKTSHIVFNVPDIEGIEGSVIHLAERPEALLSLWKITTRKKTHYVFRDIKKVDHHIIRIKGYEDSQSEENRSSKEAR